MRLLYVIDSLAANGGAEQALVEMLPFWRQSGTTVHIATLVPRYELAPRAREHGATIHPIEQGRLGRPAAVAALARSVQADLVHTTLFESDLAGRVGARLAGRRVVSSIVNTPYGPAHRRSPGLRASRVLAAQAADALTAQLVTSHHALTHHVAQTMSHRLAIPRRRMTVIPRGRDQTLLGERDEDRRARVRADLGIAPGRSVILAAARQEHQKGLDLLLRAVAEMPSPGPLLLLAGREGAATPLLESLMEELHLRDVARFLGVRSDVADLMVAADALAVPSRWEGLGSVLLEAMALRLPIVAADTPAVRETLGPEGSDCLVPPNDATGLRRGLERTLDEPERSRAIAEALHQRFSSTYTLPVVAARMLDFHEQALG